jgi:hypothetical protein
VVVGMAGDGGLFEEGGCRMGKDCARGNQGENWAALGDSVYIVQ